MNKLDNVMRLPGTKTCELTMRTDGEQEVTEALLKACIKQMFSPEQENMKRMLEGGSVQIIMENCDGVLSMKIMSLI